MDGKEQTQPLDGFETDKLTDIFTDWLQSRTDKPEEPFFAALSVQPPHDPYAAPGEWMSHFQPAGIQLRPNVPTIPAIRERAQRDLAGYYALIAGGGRRGYRGPAQPSDCLISLLDLANDPHDTHDVLAQHPEIAEALRPTFFQMHNPTASEHGHSHIQYEII